VIPGALAGSASPPSCANRKTGLRMKWPGPSNELVVTQALGSEHGKEVVEVDVHVLPSGSNVTGADGIKDWLV